MPLSHLESQLSVEAGQYSTSGAKLENQDAIGIRIPTGGTLISKGIAAVIADGVSASEGGGEASEAAVLGFLGDYFSTHDTWSVEKSATRVLNALNQWMYGKGIQLAAAEKGYVTTLSALVLKSASAYIFHVGDSRIYRKRRGEIEQITRDHKMAVGNGQHYLARAMGIDVILDVDYHRLDLSAGDLFILTTDGIHQWLSPKELTVLTDALSSNSTSEQIDRICRAIADRARTNGSDDNLSVQILCVANPGEALHTDILGSVNRSPFPPPLKPGQTIDEWTVLHEVHSSTRSDVYLVEHRETGQRAVLKAPSPYFEDDAAYIERFLFEEWIGSRVRADNVVRVIKSEKPKSFLYYLTEYVEGPTLGKLLREHTRLSVVDAQNVITQAIVGIRAFHRKDVLHQDIKPDNIIYAGNSIKIIDFGSCQAAGISEIETRISRQSALGTRDYCAPEYLLNAPTSTRSDQFSLAVLLYELLTGRLPFGEAYHKCQSERDFARLNYVPAYQINPLVPVWLDGAIQKALNFDPVKRYTALSEFARDIKKPNPEFTASRKLLQHASISLNTWKWIALGLLITNLLTLFLIY